LFLISLLIKMLFFLGFRFNYFFFWFQVFLLISFMKCLIFFQLESINVIFPLILFFSILSSFFYITIFLGLFIKKNFQFNPLTSKCYFFFSFILVSDFFFNFGFFFYEIFDFFQFYLWINECYLPPLSFFFPLAFIYQNWKTK
jgi:hypothetical protein